MTYIIFVLLVSRNFIKLLYFNQVDKQSDDIIEVKDVKRKVSIDRPTEPTYPWRRPNTVQDEVASFVIFSTK